jgi:hypothetical protein
LRFDTLELGHPIRTSVTSACKECPIKENATQGDDRLPAGSMNTYSRRGTCGSRPEGIKQRKESVEPPFGTLRRWGDQGYLLRRGLRRGPTQCTPTGLAYHLRWVLNLVGRPRLRAAAL